MARKHCWLVGILVATTGAFGCSAGPTESPPVVGLGLYGTVTGQLNGNPLNGARVTIGSTPCTGSDLRGWRCEDEIVATVTTGPDGQYHVKPFLRDCGLVGARSYYWFEVIAEGYQNLHIPRQLPSGGPLVCTTPTQTMNFALVPIPSGPGVGLIR